MSSEATSPEHGVSTSNSATATPPPPRPSAGNGEQQQIPFQMIPPGHFFANPFMNPYVPAAASPEAWPSRPPASEGEAASQGQMVFSPAQYQEMMHHYFQQMMAASGAQFPIPFPMQFQPAFQQPRPSSQASSSHRSEEDERRTAGSVASNVSPNHREITEEAKEPSSLPEVSAESVAQTSTDEVLVPTASSEVEVGEVIEKSEASDSQKGGDEKRKLSGDRTDSLIRKQMSEMEKEITRRSQNKNIKKIDDDGLAELIGATSKAAAAADAFSPFTDKSALPYTAPSATPEKPATKESLNQLRSSFNLPEDSPTVGPIPTPSPSSSSQPAQLPQQSQFANNSMFMANTDNFVQNAFPIGVAMTPQAPFAPGFQMMQPHQHNLFMQQPNPTFVNNGTNPFLQTQPPVGFVPQQQQQNGAAPLVPTVSSQHFTPEQLAAAFAQQQIAQQQTAQAPAPTPFDAPPPAAPSPSASSSTSVPSTSASGLAPPPPPSHPIPRRVSGNGNGGWPEENKENGTNSNGTVPNGSASTEDPVWVLRDSYLKKMQREQRTSAEEEMSWHEAATAAQEAAENGGGEEEEQETDRLLNGSGVGKTSSGPSDRRGSVEKKKNSKETMVHEPAVLIEGVLFRARYLGSTQMLCESRGSKAARMAQAQEAVARVKAPEGDVQPSTEIDLFISTEKIMVLNTDLQRISDTDVRQDILMDHALRTISYIADIGDLVVLMARRMSTSHSDESCSDSEGGGVRKTPKVICHVFESDEASFIAQSIGQAFQVAYVEFLRANGIDDPSYLRQIDYQEVLNSQELLGDELEMFAKKETQKEVVVPKKAGEALGIVVVESGWGSMLPTVVLAHMNPVGPAAHSNKLNIGDQIININGISLVGLPLSAAQTQIKNMKTATAVRMTVVSTPPVVEVRIRRPDTKYQLGFSVQNGVICSLLRGGIAERGGIRVGHRIIEINGTSVVAVAHDRIVNMLATAVGEIHMKTMPTSMFRLLTGQEQPQYI